MGYTTTAQGAKFIKNFKCKISLENKGRTVEFSVKFDTKNKQQAEELVKERGEVISEFFVANFERALSSAMERQFEHMYG